MCTMWTATECGDETGSGTVAAVVDMTTTTSKMIIVKLPSTTVRNQQ